MSREEITDRQYMNFHQNIRYRYGSATKCENPKCSFLEPKRFEWALRKGKKYSENIDDYIQLCPSCHRKYDETDERRNKLSKAHKGKHYHGRDRRVRRIDNKGCQMEFDTIVQASKHSKVNPVGISQCLAGRCLTAYGFKWEYCDGNPLPNKYTKK